ncbi:MAG: SRPBCC family protein, partial [Chloroflexota bacterium]
MNKTDATLELSLSRLIRAPRHRVWAAWTTPALLKQWFAPGSMAVSAAEADVRVGGRYRIGMGGDGCEGGKGSDVGGTYTEVTPESRLQFTWLLGDGSPESLVTVEFREMEGGTQVHITHQGLVDAADVARHRHGWEGILSKLEGDYARVFEIGASQERVYAALATLTGLGSWWTSNVQGSPQAQGEITFTFGSKGGCRMRVEQADEPSHVAWVCVSNDFFDDWIGTRQEFSLRRLDEERTELT